jgi:CHAD domain-containing protein
MSEMASGYRRDAEELLALLPKIRNGEPEAIHEARLATRKLRAAIPVLEAAGALERHDLAASMKLAGRALGAVRDLNVAIDSLHDIERRAPSTAAAAATLRAHLVPRRARRLRQLLKRLESLDLKSQLESLVSSGRGRLSGRRLRGGVHAALSAIPDHVEAVNAAVEHATGVYFPKRAHRVRVTVKKLRYLVELLDEHARAERPSLRPLKRIQQTLGTIHDREVLSTWLRKVSRHGDVPGAQILGGMLEAESEVEFEKFRAARADLLATCSTLHEWAAHARSASSNRAARRLLKVGAFAAIPATAAVLVFGSTHARGARRLRRVS